MVGEATGCRGAVAVTRGSSRTELPAMSTVSLCVASLGKGPVEEWKPALSLRAGGSSSRCRQALAVQLVCFASCGIDSWQRPAAPLDGPSSNRLGGIAGKTVVPATSTSAASGVSLIFLRLGLRLAPRSGSSPGSSGDGEVAGRDASKFARPEGPACWMGCSPLSSAVDDEGLVGSCPSFVEFMLHWPNSDTSVTA